MNDMRPLLRTCIGCRSACPTSEMVRLSATDRGVAVAEKGRGGRGAWLHPKRECVERAVKARAFARAFKRAVTAPDIAVLLSVVEAAARRS